MGISLTGNAEIDQQHAILEGMVDDLARFCMEPACEPNAACESCSARQRLVCNKTLAGIASEMKAFLVGHATYEERMMELLPRTAKCNAHVKGHKAAHNSLARQLMRITRQIDKECPRVLAARLEEIVRQWIGSHNDEFDSDLISQLNRRKTSEIDFDGELVAILDKYVFPNRPTGARFSPAAVQSLQRRRLEIRGRFESLSPAQREVFWLVVNGSKNSEIASRLAVSINTVKTHRAAIFQKMEVSSVLELVKKTDVLRHALDK